MKEYILEESTVDVLDEIRFGNWEYEWEIYETENYEYDSEE